MKKKNKRGNQLKQDGHKHGDSMSSSLDCTRREFVQYSTFALVAAAISLSLPGCGSDSGSDSGGNDQSEQHSFDQNSIGPGQILGISDVASPGASGTPEDIFSFSVRVDENVTYDLRPACFKEGWVGVAIPPMIQSDGSYFQTKDAEVTFTVRGTMYGKSVVSVNQDLSVTSDGETLLFLINDVDAELDSINNERDTLFTEAALLAKWNVMYPLASDGLVWLSDRVSSIRSAGVSEVITMGGDTCVITRRDIALAELMIEYVATYEAEGMANAFFDEMPVTGRTLVKKLAALLGYAAPGAFVNMTRDWTESPAGKGAIAALLTVAVPAACMCVAGNCLKKMAESDTAAESLIDGINWFANVLINQGLFAINDDMVCNYQNDAAAIMNLVTVESIDLLDDISESLLSDVPWSNSTPWSNGSPWNNTAPWNNTIWTNQPWSHTPWNNTAPWNNNIWSNNVWSNTAPWNNNAWSNTTPWNNNAWNNTWNNSWSNNPWNNFVNSGIRNV